MSDEEEAAAAAAVSDPGMGSKSKSPTHRPRIWGNFFCKIKRAVNSVKSSDKSPPPPENAVASLVSPAAVVAPPAQQVPGGASLKEKKTEASSNEKAGAAFDDKKTDASLKGKKGEASFDEKPDEPVKEKKKKKIGASFRLKKAKAAFYSRKFRLSSKKTEETSKKTEESSKKTEEAPKKTEEAPKKTEVAPKKAEEAPKTEEAPKKVDEASANDRAEASNAAKDDDNLLDEASGGEPLVPCADAESFDDDEDEDDDEGDEEEEDDNDDYSYGADYLMQSTSDDVDAKFVGLESREANDFIFGKLIGEGSFSTVYLAKDIHTQKELAIKVCRKTHIIREKKVEHIKREKEILSLLNARCNPTAPFFVKLYCTFQDRSKLYFAVTYAKYGDLLTHINRVGSFESPCCRFYSAEILRALEHMHSLGIIHRDLKPENILLDERMHIKITDFGSAKVLKLDDEGLPLTCRRRNSFVGTAQYISPDLLRDVSECSRSSDLWAFGTIIYQMVSGLPPFRSNSEYLIFKQIRNVDYNFPEGFCSCARDLVKKLLVADPKKRLGARDGLTYDSIRAHEYYEGLDFETLYKQEPPRIYPYLPGTSRRAEMRSHYKVPDNLEPGLDDRQITRLLGLELQGPSPPRPAPRAPPAERTRKRSGTGMPLKSMSPQDIEVRLLEQRLNALVWHNLCDGNLIVKKGLIDKRKGLFARRRMLMLTLGPHLYYADPVSMVLKGEIPWSEELRVEAKNFKIFFVHTPHRTYYLEDPEGYALEWCKAIDEVRIYTYGPQAPPKRDQDRKT